MTKTKAVCRKITPKKFNKKPAKPAAAAPSERRGIFFAPMGKQRRAVYEQKDHTLILADLCCCRVEYLKGTAFEVVRSRACPIDEHSADQYDESQPSPTAGE